MVHHRILVLATLVSLTHGGVSTAQTSDRRSAFDHYRRGCAFNDEGEFDKALASLNEAIRLDPTLANAYLSRGVSWACKGENDKALADYDRHIELSPASFVGYGNRGGIWFRKKDYKKALADYDKSLRISPRYAFAHVGRGNVRTMQERFDEAISEYDEAIRLQPDMAIAYVNRGYIHERRQEFGRAVADYKEVLTVDPADRFKSHKYAHWNLGWVLATCPDTKYRDGEKAVIHATRACELSRWGNGLIVTALAAAYAETGDFTGAVEWERQALETLPDTDVEYPRAEERLELYLRRQRYRDVTPGPIRFE